MSGPCLSSSVAGRPLRPATRHSLGEPLPHQQADRPRAHQEASCDFGVEGMSPLATCGINSPFGELSPTSRQIAHVLRTRSPLDFSCITTQTIPFDLHVLSTPPAFVLSQNQTLRINITLLPSVPATQLPRQPYFKSSFCGSQLLGCRALHSSCISIFKEPLCRTFRPVV